MTNPSSQAYLRDAVMTATPEQLQLMLYDGAIRFAAQGRDALEAKNFEQAFEKLSRAQKIVLEMERGLNHEIDPALCERMSALYLFIYRKLVDACAKHESRHIDDALEILHFERETWVLLLDKLADGAVGAPRAAPAPAEMPTEVNGTGTLSIEG